MSLNQTLLAEFIQEAATTRKLLALVPFEKGDYKPHEKSMSLNRLATHVAEIAGWWKECLVNDELDFAAGDFTPKVLNSTDDLLAMFDDYVAKSTVILNETPESEFDKNWTMRQGDMIFFTLPKAQVVRTWCLNHWVHHRAQLGVYLRLLDIPVPGSYGPSADDNG
ncbi:MAG: DinB family protein [Chitinophagaceae bacterium]|nr:DinB family protein [Chitinophagaceae bacterium]